MYHLPLIIPAQMPKPYEMSPDMIEAITILCKNPGRKMTSVPRTSVSSSYHFKSLCDWDFCREIGSYVFIPTKACRSFFWSNLLSSQERDAYHRAAQEHIDSTEQGERYYDLAREAVEAMRPIIENPWQDEDSPLRDQWNWSYLSSFEWQERTDSQLGYSLFRG